jgi:ParB-like chromosome segregation protein Spo0J
LPTIRAVVLDVDEGRRLAIQATANLARQDVRPCEEARAYQKIVDQLRAEKPWLSEEEARKRCAAVTGKPLQRVAYKLKLLALPVEVQELVDKGALGEGQAQALGRLAATRAKLAGAAKHLGALLAEVDAARGSDGPVSVAVPGGECEGSAGRPEALRTEVRGQWFWVYGAPAPNGQPLTRDLYLAGAVWSSRRGAWYAPDEARAQRVAAVIEGYQQAAPEVSA